MKQVSFLLVSLCLCARLVAQHDLTGKVTDMNGNALPGASVFVEELYQGTASNASGEFVFNRLKPGEYNVKVSYLGREATTKTVEIPQTSTLEFRLSSSNYLADEVIVVSTKARNNAPVTVTNLGREQIRNVNTGQDLPYMIALTPSLVTNSDAGAGVGYTNLRIRGTDQNRINVMINGIPLNDPESHGVFWVNMPDFASSLDNIQIQRGVGTSSNGSAAFGATINMQTQTLRAEPYTEFNSSAGSFNTFRNNIKVGSGLIDDKFSFDARLSRITSDGYIERAFSDMYSWYTSGAYHTKKTLVRVNLFSGSEKTYQAWDGVPSYMLGVNRRFNGIGAYSDEEGNTLYYDNETDNYKQTHLHVIVAHELSRGFTLNTALHYTLGEGYYEQYKGAEKVSKYGLEPINLGGTTISKTDLIRQKWLDNHFYGITFSANYQSDKLQASLGGGANLYDGDHFGDIIWTKYPVFPGKEFRWYTNKGVKKDLNLYGKINYQPSSLGFFADMQVRGIHYSIDGLDDKLRDITQAHPFLFFNPKTGVFWKPNDRNTSYITGGISQREPNRANYVDADPSRPLPVHEVLYNIEAGHQYTGYKWTAGVNFFIMEYDNQLVMLGQINDVGAPIMTNVKDSYRRGIELVGGIKFSRYIQWNLNLSLSQNKIRNFTEYIDNWSYWDNPEEEPYQYENVYKKSNLAFSPPVVAGSHIVFSPTSWTNLHLFSKYVGKQYIDNTSSEERKLSAYFLNDIKIDIHLGSKPGKEKTLFFQVHNLLDEEYISNAWIYPYYENKLLNIIDGYYPQAGRHFTAGVSLRF